MSNRQLAISMFLILPFGIAFSTSTSLPKKLTHLNNSSLHLKRDFLANGLSILGQLAALSVNGPSESEHSTFTGTTNGLAKTGFMTSSNDISASGLDPKRAKAFNRPVVNRYFDGLNQLVESHNIPIENIYNMDEKGCQRGGGKNSDCRG
jgi:hypothetical protein